MGEIEKKFREVFGDMYLSESETALRVFELGYKAGAAAENEACAKACESLNITNDGVKHQDYILAEHQDYLEGKYIAALHCAAAIRSRGK